ncbi:AMP-binding protein [Paraburkholderia sp. BCC1886]|uniref:AMP-binding protein n=1 Tax=Paraburkholderia sp. BCC1886 TaxID=2562670 RepID=UPI00118316C1|nr:AMP-binding protein [Paraburkholderia sp. BCC1886]
MQDYALEDRTMGRVIAEKAKRIPQKTFLIWKGQKTTYGELETITNRYANGFAAQGVRHGDHVAIMLPNCPEFFWTVWGLNKLGAVAVPINTAAKGELLRYFLEKSEATAFIVDEEWNERIAAVRDELPLVRRYYIHGQNTAGWITSNDASSVHPLSSIESGDTSQPPPDRVAHDDTQLIMFTSGTTGPSKGVQCPHSQGHAVGRALTLNFGYRDDDVLYTCLPLFHGNAAYYSVYAALWADAAIALAPRFSATRFWDEIRSTGATQFNTLGAMTNIIWKLPPGPHERETRLRLCMAVPVPKEIYTEFQERFGVTLTSVFAMTENFAMTTFTPGDPAEKAGSAGKPRGECKLRIVDDEGNDLPPREVGEIYMLPLKPGSMMKGYYKMPKETAKEFDDGWFKTGDRGYLDEDGYLYFMDRKKEAIRRRGENISAYEVELILCRHPAIHEVAAIPVASELSEDDVMVYVVLKPGESMTHADVVNFSNDHMSYFMVPRFVEFVEKLPKTASEKLEKYKLKLDAQERRAQLWDREKEGIVVKR